MIEKAILVPRPEATKKVVSKRDMDRVVFSVSYQPTLPSIPLIIATRLKSSTEEMSAAFCVISERRAFRLSYKQ